jgi:hypothetical protein
MKSLGHFALGQLNALNLMPLPLRGWKNSPTSSGCRTPLKTIHFATARDYGKI